MLSLFFVRRDRGVERVEKLDRDKLVDRKDKGKPSNEDRL